jgi:hypothetical protein
MCVSAQCRSTGTGTTRAARRGRRAAAAQSGARSGPARSHRRRAGARRYPRGNWLQQGSSQPLGRAVSFFVSPIRQSEEQKGERKFSTTTYTSQGENPLVDLVRQVLRSCGMSCTVQKIAPAGDEERVSFKKVFGGCAEVERHADPWFQTHSQLRRSRALLSCPRGRRGVRGRGGK